MSNQNWQLNEGDPFAPSTPDTLEHLPSHHCVIDVPAQPDTSRFGLQADGKHPAPCARHCESNAYEIELKRRDMRIAELEAHLDTANAALHATLSQQAQAGQEPIDWNDWRRELAEKVDAYIQAQSENEGDEPINEAYDDLKAHILKTPFVAPPAPANTEASHG